MWIESQKIWKFESPEELARALEEKNKKLAERVRDISRVAIEKKSRDLRRALQEELTPEEQSEIVEILPESWVGEVFDKKTSVDVWREAIWEVIWKENVDKIEKVEWFFNRISIRFDKVWEVFKTKWIVAWLWAILLMFKWIFTLDFSWFDRLLNPDKKGEKDEKKEENDNELNETKKNELKYLWGIQLLFLVKWEKEKDYAKTILLQKEVKIKSFNELNKNFKEWKNWISERLWLTSKWNDEEVYNSIKLIIDNESFINSTIWKVKPDWREEELWNILLELHKKWSLLNWIHKNLSKIELSATSPFESFNKLFNIDILSINFDSEKNDIDFWDFFDRTELINWVSKTTLLKIFGWEKIKNSSDEKVRSRYYWLCEENEKIFIDKLFTFHWEMTKTMSSLFGNENYSKFQEYFNTNWISSKDLTELYLITW